MTTSKSMFMLIAVVLFVVAAAVAYMSDQYVGYPSDPVPNVTAGLLSAGLAVAGGLALVAAAIEGRSRE